MEKQYKDKIKTLETQLSKEKSINLLLSNEINSLKLKEKQLTLEKNSVDKEILNNSGLLQKLKAKDVEAHELKENNEKLERKIEELEEKVTEFDKLKRKVQKLTEELQKEKENKADSPDCNSILFLISNQNISQKNQFYKKIGNLQQKLDEIEEKEAKKPENVDFLMEIMESLLQKNKEKSVQIEKLSKRNDELERNNRQFNQINHKISNYSEENHEAFALNEAVSEEVIIHEEGYL